MAPSSQRIVARGMQTQLTLTAPPHTTIPWSNILIPTGVVVNLFMVTFVLLALFSVRLRIRLPKPLGKFHLNLNPENISFVNVTPEPRRRGLVRPFRVDSAGNYNHFRWSHGSGFSSGDKEIAMLLAYKFPLLTPPAVVVGTTVKKHTRKDSGSSATSSSALFSEYSLPSSPPSSPTASWRDLEDEEEEQEEVHSLSMNRFAGNCGTVGDKIKSGRNRWIGLRGQH